MKRKYSVLEQILSDAVVVDIDLTMWRTEVGLFCIADHLYDPAKHQKLPLMHILFKTPLLLQVDFPTVAWTEKYHPVWAVDDFVVKIDGATHVECWGFEQTPRLKVVACAVAIQEIDYAPFDLICPEGFEPMSPIGLARPSAKRMAELLLASRRGRKH